MRALLCAIGIGNREKYGYFSVNIRCQHPCTLLPQYADIYSMDIKHIENSYHGVTYEESIALRREINILTTDMDIGRSNMNAHLSGKKTAD